MRKLLGSLLVVVIALAAVGGALLFLQSRDDAGVGGTATGPGERVDDRCPAREVPVTRDRRKLSRDQIQTALAQGNVVLFYARRPLPELRELQRDFTGGAFDAEIAAAGQAVILADNDPPSGYQARAWGRRLTVTAPNDQKLRQFTEAWLGKGAPKPCPS